MLYGKAMASNAKWVSYAFLLPKSKSLLAFIAILIFSSFSLNVFGQCVNGSINIGSNVGLPNASQVPSNSMGQINNGKIYCVNGNFQFNAVFTQIFNDCYFFINPGGKLIVDGPLGPGSQNLKFVNCKFHPSGLPFSKKYWKGFEFKGQVNVELSGCEIIGAEFGTYIDIHKNSKLNITTTKFTENVLGCVFRGEIPQKLSLDNNTFSILTGELLSQYPGQTKPNWVPNFRISKFMRAYDINAKGKITIVKNKFYKLQNAIVSNTADINILDNEFHDVQYDPNTLNGKGIEVKNSNDLRIVRNFLNNVHFLAFIQNCYTICEDNIAIKGKSGFEFVDCNDRVVMVKDNKHIEVTDVGVTVRNSKNIGLVVNNNVIYVENPKDWIINKVADGGIFLENVIASTLPWVYSDVFNNTIYLYTQGREPYGIQGIKMAGFHIHYNNIFNAMVHSDFAPGSQNLNEVKGINLNQTSNNYFISNFLERTVQATCGGPMSSTGIKTNMSVNDKYCGNNTIRRFETGAQFSGVHDKLCFSQTYFDNNCIGLEYTLNTSSNDQRLAGNQWFGTFGINRAINRNNIPLGKYYTSTNQLPFFPIGFYPPGWFNTTTIGTEGDQCCVTDTILDNKDKLISKNQLYPQQGLEGYRWESEKQLFSKLSIMQMPQDSAYQAFWAYQIATPIAFFTQLERQTDELYDCELNDNLRKRDLRELLVQQEIRKKLLLEQMELVEPGSQGQQLLLTEINLLNDSLNLETEELHLLHSNCISQAQVKASQLITQLQSIVPTTIPQTTQYHVYKIYLSRIAENREFFTEPEIQILAPLAMACEKTHGKSVTLAGIMLRVNDPESSIESECPESTPTGLSRKFDLTGFSAAPNPSQDGFITLQLPTSKSKLGWTIKVLDLHGKLYQEHIVEQGMEQYVLNLANPGLWIVQAVNPEGMASIKVIFN